MVLRPVEVPGPAPRLRHPEGRHILASTGWPACRNGCGNGSPSCA